MIDRPLGWFGIARLGLVQAGIGSIVVLTTSTMNRIMVVELAFPAVLPGALVGLHYAVQLLRPVWGHGSDTAERRTPWIIFGAIVLAVGAIGAASAVAWMGTNTIGGILAAIGAFTLIGIGVGAAGTSVLALLASRVDSSKRAGAATAVWLMMIAGIVVTAITAGHFLDPYTPKRLIAVTSIVGITSVLLTIIALWGVESGSSSIVSVRWRPRAAHIGFADAIARVWSNDEARRFTVFVFVSMLAYSAQDLILEPFAGSVFGFTPGETTKLSGTQHAGVFAGMLLVGVLGTVGAAKRGGALRVWSIGGCIASALMLVGLALGAVIGPPWPLSAKCLRPRRLKWCVRRGCYRLDDGACRKERGKEERRCADGRVGSSARDCLWPRRLSGDRLLRSRPHAHRTAGVSHMLWFFSWRLFFF